MNLLKSNLISQDQYLNFITEVRKSFSNSGLPMETLEFLNGICHAYYFCLLPAVTKIFGVNKKEEW